jgi:hypothetical protein
MCRELVQYAADPSCVVSSEKMIEIHFTKSYPRIKEFRNRLNSRRYRECGVLVQAQGVVQWQNRRFPSFGSIGRPRINSTREKHPYIYVYMPISRAFCRIGEGIGRDSVGF